MVRGCQWTTLLSAVALTTFYVMDVWAVDDLNFSVDILAPQADNPPAATASALQSLCPSILDTVHAQASDLERVCAFTTVPRPGNEPAVEAVLEELSAKPNTALVTQLIRSAPVRNVTGFGARLSALRRNNRSPVTRFRAVETENSPTSLFAQRLSGYVTGSALSSNKDDTSSEEGFKAKTYGLIGGGDYRFGSNTFVGAALLSGKSSAELKDAGSDMNATYLALAAYSSHFLNDQWYLEVSADTGKQSMEIHRSINFTIDNITTRKTAVGKTDAAQFDVSIGSGYEFTAPRAVVINTAATLTYYRSSIDEYTETNADDLALTVSGNSMTSLASQVTASASRAFSLSQGVLIPQIFGIWIHEFKQDRSVIDARFAADTLGTHFRFTTEKPDANYLLTGVDAQYLAVGGRTGFFRLSTTLRLRARSESALVVGYRMEL